MSPEINGNPPSAPSVVRRKKSKKNSAQKTENGYQVFKNSIGDLSVPEMSSYYSVLNYTSNNSEPMSLPIYHQQKQGFINNFTSTPRNNYLQIPTSNNYTSLPPNLDPNVDEAGRRRFSDPGLPNDEISDEDDSTSNSFENKIIQKLTNQVNLLKECNRRLSKEVMEIRVELNLMKSQIGNNLRHFDRDYEPGMLADIIREVRDAARVREDALLAKVKYIMDEKQLSMNHLHLVNEKNRSNNDRIAKLEEQIKNLSINNKSEDVQPPTMAPSSASLSSSSIVAVENGAHRQVLELEREALELRRELQDTRARKEEADQKVLLLDKKLSSILKRANDVSTSDISEAGRTDSVDSVSVLTAGSSTNHSGLVSGGIPRVTMSGPVTDL